MMKRHNSRLVSVALLAAAALLSACSSGGGFRTETINFSRESLLEDGREEKMTFTAEVEVPVGDYSEEVLRACRFDIIEALGLGCETVVENADIPSALEYAYNKFDQDYHQSASQVLEAFKDSEDSSFMASLNWEMDLRANFMIPARGYQSLYFERYTFLGGAHGQGQKGALCYKLASGERVKLDNLFTEGSREILSERLSDALVRQAEQEGFLDALFTRQAPVSESFYICEDGICFIYGQYQLGPYYLGCLEIMLSWDEVSDILKQ